MALLKGPAGPVLALSLLGFVVANCGGDAAPNPGPTTEATLAAATAVPTPLVEGERVTSTAVGYEATIPDGWRLSANVLTSPTLRSDAYFQGEGADPASPPASITVSCDLVESAGDLDEAVARKIGLLKQLGRLDVAQSDVPAVDGREAAAVTYTLVLPEPPTPEPPNPPTSSSEPLVMKRREVIFYSSRCLWTISLGVRDSETTPPEAAFAAFLSSFKLIGS